MKILAMMFLIMGLTACTINGPIDVEIDGTQIHCDDYNYTDCGMRLKRCSGSVAEYFCMTNLKVIRRNY